MTSNEGEFLPDIECGGNTTEEVSKDQVPTSNRGKKMLTRVHSGVLNFNGSVSDESDVDSSDGFQKSIDVVIERSGGGEDMRDLVPLLDKRSPNDKRKKPDSKKAGKPPRPPKGPELSAADLQLVKELSELAARKRARIERMKELRKMKEARKMSSSNNLTAMVITILFFIVLIFQGVFCRTSIGRKVLGSPAPTVALETQGLTSAQLFNNAPSNQLSGPVSMPPRVRRGNDVRKSHPYPYPYPEDWDQTFSSSPREQEGRDFG